MLTPTPDDFMNQQDKNENNDMEKESLTRKSAHTHTHTQAQEIQAEDYKRIKHELNLTPSQWFKLQDLNHLRLMNFFAFDTEIRVFHCKCRSVWCKNCRVSSPTNQEICRKLRIMDWRKTRHVILTTNRDETPEKIFREIQAKKALPALVRALHLKTSLWLWVLEFHRGGYPHWHLLIESDGMIGKNRIQEKWGFGNVWESYIQNEGHWGAIAGYYKKKGYLAGESKEHQVELPDFLEKSSRVRKFGSNIRNTPPESPLTPPGSPLTPPKGKNRAKSSTYAERFGVCDTECFIEVNGTFKKIYKSGGAVKEALSGLDSIDYQTFRGERGKVLGAIEGL